MLILELAIIVVLIVVNGLLSMSELAIVSSRPARLEILTQRQTRMSEAESMALAVREVYSA
jgi:putative hemolysin